MATVESSTLWWVIVFAAIGICATVPKIYRATITFWQGVWFLVETHKHKGDMRKALRMLPRLLRARYVNGTAAENILPHLIYYFEPGGRVHNTITGDIQWLEHLAPWLKKCHKGSRLRITLHDEEDKPHELNILRTTMQTSDGQMDILLIADYNGDGFINEHLSFEMWPFLTTVKFYCSDISYVLIENCPESVVNLCAIPVVEQTIDGRCFTVFAATESMVNLIIAPDATI